MKRCTKCIEEKPLSEYSFQRYTRKDGTHLQKTVCKQCINEYSKGYYQEHKADHTERGRKWRKSNRERCVDIYRKCRALKYSKNYDVGITLEKIYIRDKSICGICKTTCERKDTSMDHIIPLSRGGTHTWNNVQLAHRKYNSMKGNRI